MRQIEKLERFSQKVQEVVKDFPDLYCASSTTSEGTGVIDILRLPQESLEVVVSIHFESRFMTLYAAASGYKYQSFNNLEYFQQLRKMLESLQKSGDL